MYSRFCQSPLVSHYTASPKLHGTTPNSWTTRKRLERVCTCMVYLHFVHEQSYYSAEAPC